MTQRMRPMLRVVVSWKIQSWKEVTPRKFQIDGGR
jgi:hypothetical protein